jgi:hypothetical protein
MRRTAARSEFTVGSFMYVIEFEDGEFRLFIDGRRSRTVNLFEPSDRDEFDSYMLQHIDERKIFAIKERASNRHAISVYRFARRFVEMIIHTERPYLFRFSANEQRKTKLYESFSVSICNKFTYHLCSEGRNFTFYRLRE